ncbi:3-phosphoshikimate 1-carboxyvinyltransferase [Dermatophilus congolensis]|nr:3-phosphoshikimate 1-carboxyvinyltransferase [Dermatophilus congolensis]MBO3152060.1 3-phosphoshikimate 1-carboxyvinyltransferase [Dermatophilus congolensis]MBO3160928.1 3-phosphoshikimate 1-carboxyvinyltransferase [Dermatophilus congolensis]MBO3163346.1 3-phosphoshikimate 1-carboxyvinyltransferase [Dermatophilus congolensis]MBO3176899.1 3-phosphoshikimate 1-carboxyvinyltransferase [Dermatophilus congolensis]
MWAASLACLVQHHTTTQTRKRVIFSIVPTTDLWKAPAAADVATALDATVRLPGSKSLTNRFLVLAALADGESRLRAPLHSRDTLLMAQGLRAMGTSITDLGDADSGDWLVRPAALGGNATVDCGLAGTVMRFLPAVATLAAGPVRFDGDAGARVRPMAPVLQAITDLGIRTESAGGFLPATVHGSGTVTGGALRIDASHSSQFVSAMLLVGARFSKGLELVHTGSALPSQPHIDMTIEVLRDVGVEIDDETPHRWVVEPGDIRPLDVTVEPDLSNAAAFLAAVPILGGRLHIPDWPAHTTQAGDRIRDILALLGARVELDRTGLTVTADCGFEGFDLDLSEAGELTPTVAALAACAHSPSHLHGVAHLRGHETDRLAALATEINRLGGDVTETDDGLVIRPSPLRPAQIATYHDHRMATAAAILALKAPGSSIENIATTSKTLPGFADMWMRMLGVETAAERTVVAS